MTRKEVIDTINEYEKLIALDPTTDAAKWLAECMEIFKDILKDMI